MDEPIPPHGTRARYNSRIAGCRCETCREANTRYMRLYRAHPPPAGWAQLTIQEAL